MVQIISKQHGSRFYSKHEATDFNANTAENNGLKCFKDKPKLIGSTVVANRILKNAIIAVLLKYVSSYWRSIEMPWIN